MTTHVLVRVPATTANLGPGFDCLGLTLDLWNEVEVRLTGTDLKISITGESAGRLPVDTRNVIHSTMKALVQNRRIHLPEGIQIICRNNIPLGSGLGSSAAAVVAGVLAANTLFDLHLTVQEQLDLSSAVEGHPDNAAPCLLGGLTACMQIDHGVMARKLPVKELPILIALPDFNFPTKKARSVLPQIIPHHDAVFNISRTVMVTQALQEGDVDLLSEAMQDRLHQPYRLPLIPGAQQAMQAAYQAGAAAVCLSGAGPALLAVCRGDEDCDAVEEAMHRSFSSAGLSMRYFQPKISMTGAEIELLD